MKGLPASSLRWIGQLYSKALQRLNSHLEEMVKRIPESGENVSVALDIAVILTVVCVAPFLQITIN